MGLDSKIGRYQQNQWVEQIKKKKEEEAKKSENSEQNQQEQQINQPEFVEQEKAVFAEMDYFAAMNMPLIHHDDVKQQPQDELPIMDDVATMEEDGLIAPSNLDHYDMPNGYMSETEAIWNEGYEPSTNEFSEYNDEDNPNHIPPEPYYVDEPQIMEEAMPEPLSDEQMAIYANDLETQEISDTPQMVSGDNYMGYLAEMNRLDIHFADHPEIVEEQPQDEPPIMDIQTKEEDGLVEDQYNPDQYDGQDGYMSDPEAIWNEGYEPPIEPLSDEQMARYANDLANQEAKEEYMPDNFEVPDYNANLSQYYDEYIQPTEEHPTIDEETVQNDFPRDTEFTNQHWDELNVPTDVEHINPEEMMEELHTIQENNALSASELVSLDIENVDDVELNADMQTTKTEIESDFSSLKTEADNYIATTSEKQSAFVQSSLNSANQRAEEILSAMNINSVVNEFNNQLVSAIADLTDNEMAKSNFEMDGTAEKLTNIINDYNNRIGSGDFECKIGNTNIKMNYNVDPFSNDFYENFTAELSDGTQVSITRVNGETESLTFNNTATNESGNFNYKNNTTVYKKMDGKNSLSIEYNNENDYSITSDKDNVNTNATKKQNESINENQYTVMELDENSIPTSVTGFKTTSANEDYIIDTTNSDKHNINTQTCYIDGNVLTTTYEYNSAEDKVTKVAEKSDSFGNILEVSQICKTLSSDKCEHSSGKFEYDYTQNPPTLTSTTAKNITFDTNSQSSSYEKSDDYVMGKIENDGTLFDISIPKSTVLNETKIENGNTITSEKTFTFDITSDDNGVSTRTLNRAEETLTTSGEVDETIKITQEKIDGGYKKTTSYTNCDISETEFKMDNGANIHQLKTPGATLTEKEQDGKITKTLTREDGSSYFLRADGTSCERKADGTFIDYGNDGEIEIASSDGRLHSYNSETFWGQATKSINLAALASMSDEEMMTIGFGASTVLGLGAAGAMGLSTATAIGSIVQKVGIVVNGMSLLTNDVNAGAGSYMKDSLNDTANKAGNSFAKGGLVFGGLAGSISGWVYKSPLIGIAVAGGVAMSGLIMSSLYDGGEHITNTGSNNKHTNKPKNNSNNYADGTHY